MSQEQTKRQGGGGGDDEDGTGAEASGQERREKLGEDVDTILDEIDDVLEENAEDFVRAYVQKGGEEPRLPVRVRPPCTRAPDRATFTPIPAVVDREAHVVPRAPAADPPRARYGRAARQHLVHRLPRGHRPAPAPRPDAGGEPAA